MALIDVSRLTFGYEGSGRIIFDNVSFRLDTAWKLGFMGRNGRGKTTFLKLLMGRHEYSGTIAAPVRFLYFPQEVKAGETVEAMARRVCPQAEPWRLLRELSLLQVDESVATRPLAELSGGERAKAMLAALFLNDSGFLLIDEPTNHLDAHGRAVLGEYLSRKSGFILVSHDRTLLDACVDHVLSINKADIELLQGNYATWRQNRDYRDQFEAARQEKLEKDMKRLTEAARRSAVWSDKTEASKIGTHVPDRGFVGHKAAKMMKRSKSLEARREKALEQTADLLRNVEEDEPLLMRPLRHHASRLLEASGLTLNWGGERLLQVPDFAVSPGDRLALTGGNGSGKTTLLRLLAGENSGVGVQGHFRRASGLLCSVVPQDTTQMSGSPEDMALARGLEQNLFRAVLARLDVPRSHWRENMRNFSDGQRKKMALAASLCDQAHVYLWDEPLNFVDIVSREQIEDVILACRPTLVFVEHDRAFVRRVATREVEL